MTVATTPTETWQGLDWRKMQANVFRLQKRIYQAAQRNEVRQVHSLHCGQWFRSLI